VLIHHCFLSILHGSFLSNGSEIRPVRQDVGERNLHRPHLEFDCTIRSEENLLAKALTILDLLVSLVLAFAADHKRFYETTMHHLGV
jgi:hypothetical protein